MSADESDVPVREFGNLTVEDEEKPRSSKKEKASSKTSDGTPSKETKPRKGESDENLPEEEEKPPSSKKGEASSKTSEDTSSEETKLRKVADNIKNYFLMTKNYGENHWLTYTAMVCRMTRTVDGKVLLKDFDSIGNHAEHNLIKDKEINDFLKTAGTSATVDIFINYSPCCECAHKIVNFVREYKTNIEKITIKIANFYRINVYHYNDQEQAEINLSGLLSLLKEPKVTLQTFNGIEDWNELFPFYAVGGKYVEELLKELATRNERKQREELDAKILGLIYGNQKNLKKLVKDIGVAIKELHDLRDAERKLQDLRDAKKSKSVVVDKKKKNIH